jgi:hypothetical protein
MLMFLFPLLAQQKIDPKNAPVPDAGYSEIFLSWWFIGGVVVLLGLVGFLVYRLMKKPE